MTKSICIGAIAGAFGVRGEVRLKSFTSQPEDIASYGTVTNEDASQSFTITITRTIKNGMAARLSGVARKEQADALKGTRIYVPRDRLPKLPDDEFYYSDLIGLEVRDTGGTLLGRVKAVQDYGADDLLEIHGAGLKDSVFLPFTRANVPTVDLAQGRIVADPPDRLFPEQSDD